MVYVPDVDDEDLANLSHRLVRGVDGHVPAVAERARPHRRFGGDHAHFGARAAVPDAQRRVGGPGHEVLSLPVDVHRPHGSCVAIEGAETLSVQRVPYVRRVIFGRREE